MKLKSKLSIDEITTRHQELKDEFDTIEQLDFSDVDFFDTSGIQLILAFLLSKDQKSQNVSILNLSHDYCEKIKILGLWNHFETRIVESE